MSSPIFLTTGPSKLYPQVGDFMREAFESGILSRSHRSPAFSELYERVVALFRQKFGLPADYKLYFLSSATEIWDVLAEGLFSEKSTLHYYSGAFGERWFYHTRALTQRAEDVKFAPEDFTELLLERDFSGYSGVCLTLNETSNGSQIPAAALEKLRLRAPEVLLAVDVTSSLGGVETPFRFADVWFASVQKCLGLPSGLGVLFCSPRAVENFHAQNYRKRYNALPFQDENAQKSQTTHTPNILGIYLLKRVLETIPSIKEIDLRTKKRAQIYYDWFEGLRNITPYIKVPNLRSDTVFCLQTKQPDVLRAFLEEAGIIAASGYGQFKSTTFRIANFPAVEDLELDQLKTNLARWDAQPT